METDRENISKKFNEIKNEMNLSEKNLIKSKISKNNTHKNFEVRPKLQKFKNKSFDKAELNHMLEQIGSDYLLFNNDKLITNIKIESYETISKKNSIVSNDNDKSFISKRTNKTNSKSVKQRKNNKQKSNIIQNRNKIDKLLIPNTINKNHNTLETLELNCNKISYIKDNYKKNNKNNSKKNIIKNKSKSKYIKNIDQFINKPNDLNRISKKNILMTPINNKSKISIQNNNNKLKNIEFSSSKKKLVKNNNNNNDNSSISSTSRIRGRSMPNMRTHKSQNNLRLPNKSIIKNKDKIMIELQKIFGEKMQLNDDIYQNMTELDKKNCINFLLEVVKEMNNINKMNKSKNDGYKQLIEAKDEEIKKYKNEIKELKKEILKLNKIIRNTNQLNKKLNQNLESLKLQLEKEKLKNKNLQNIRDKSTSKINNVYTKRYRNENSINKTGLNKENKSHDKIKKDRDRGFIARIKRDSSNDKKKNSLDKNEINKNNIYEKIEANITWKNIEENRTDISQNSKISNYSKEQNDLNYNILNE